MSRFATSIAGLLVVIAPAAGLAQTPPPLVQKSYPVADLVVPLERAAAQAVKEKDAVPDVSMGPRFAQLIVGTIEPKSWREGGGPGIVEFVPTTKTLVVSQTEAMHQKVAGLLADLRQSQDVLIEVDVRLLTVCDSFCERIGVDFNPKLPNADPEQTQGSHFAESRPAVSDEDVQTLRTLMMMTDSHENIVQRLDRTFVNDRQLFLILEAAQGDRRSNVVQGPKITVLNGQMGTVSTGEQQFFTPNRFEGSVCFVPGSKPLESGIRITTQPVASPDRRLVNLYLKVEEKELAEPLAILSREMEKTLAIPCGQTAVLLSGRRVVEHREQVGPPILAKIPYVNRLFRNTAYGRDTVLEFVLVTPRIVPLDGRPAPSEAAVKRGYEDVGTLAPRSRIADMTSATLAKPEATSPEAGKALLRELEPSPRPSDVVAVLQKAYLQARAEGRVEEAERLSRALLAIDPKMVLPRQTAAPRDGGATDSLAASPKGRAETRHVPFTKSATRLPAQPHPGHFDHHRPQPPIAGLADAVASLAVAALVRHRRQAASAPSSRRLRKARQPKNSRSGSPVDGAYHSSALATA